MPTEPSATHGQDCTIANPCQECRQFMERKPMDAEKALADAHGSCPCKCWNSHREGGCVLCKEHHADVDALARAAFEAGVEHEVARRDEHLVASIANQPMPERPLPKWLTETSR